MQPSQVSSKPNKTEVSIITSHQGSKEASVASNNLEKKKQAGAKARAKKDDSGGKSIPIPRKYRPPKLDTPEEIEKWRAERRKNWPSDKVIQQKEKQKKEMLERGELRDDEKNAVGLKGVGNKTGGVIEIKKIRTKREKERKKFSIIVEQERKSFGEITEEIDREREKCNIAMLQAFCRERLLPK